MLAADAEQIGQIRIHMFIYNLFQLRVADLSVLESAEHFSLPVNQNPVFGSRFHLHIMIVKFLRRDILYHSSSPLLSLM